MSRAKLTTLSGIGPEKEALLRANGFTTLGRIAQASPTALSAVPGIGLATARKLKAQAARLLPAPMVVKRTSKKKPTSRKKTASKKNKTAPKPTVVKRKTTKASVPAGTKKAGAGKKKRSFGAPTRRVGTGPAPKVPTGGRIPATTQARARKEKAAQAKAAAELAVAVEALRAWAQVKPPEAYDLPTPR